MFQSVYERDTKEVLLMGICDIIPRRRYTHPRCRTSPTIRNKKKTADETIKYVTRTKIAEKLYPTIPCNNPDSDIGWKTQLSLSNWKNRSTSTSATIRQRKYTVEYPVKVNALLRKTV